MSVFSFCTILAMFSVVGALIFPPMMRDLGEYAYRGKSPAKRKEMLLREMNRRLAGESERGGTAARPLFLGFGERFLRSLTNEALLRENADIADEMERESAAAEKMKKIVFASSDVA